MEYNRSFFIIIYFLTVSTLFYAMNQDRLPIIDEITSVKNPKYARYITQDRVVIGGQDGCSVINLETKEEHKLCKNGLSADFVKLKVADQKVIYSADFVIKIYNVETGAQEWSTKEPVPVTDFVLSKDVIFLCYESDQTTLYNEFFKNAITKCNYKTNAREDIAIHDKCCRTMVMHPNQEIICRADLDGNSFLCKADNLAKLKEIKTRIKFWNYQYSPDGSCIAASADKVCIITFNLNGFSYSSLDPQEDDECLRYIAFHPNSLILATLSKFYKGFIQQKKCVVRYWDIKTKKLLYTIPELHSDDCYDLCFSPDGLETMVVLRDKCVRIPVPFLIKEKGAYCLFLLKQIRQQEGLLQDVTDYCAKILLKTFGY